MSCCDDVFDGASRRYNKENTPMKKIMSLMLGMSLVLGAATVAFAQSGDTMKSTKKSKKKKGSGGTGSSSSK
jgi:hypothetical protein